MDAFVSILIALAIAAAVLLLIGAAVTWWDEQEQRERDRLAAEAEQERAELRAAMLRFQAETNAAAHEARKALIAEALRFGQRQQQVADSSEEGSR